MVACTALAVLIMFVVRKYRMEGARTVRSNTTIKSVMLNQYKRF
jgi:hypothetical protein